MKTLHLLTVTAALLIAPLVASGTDVYSCPTADGTVSFTDKPCAGGTEIRIAPAQTVSYNPGPSARVSGRDATEEFLAKRSARASRVKARYAAKQRAIQEERRHQETVKAIRSVGAGSPSLLTGHRIYTWR